MEFTLDEALKKGIEAHKSGSVQEADRYYTAILKANPKHPDANHNMGVLAVGTGKFEAALPFFRKALEGNPNVSQFWLSYIDALIRLNRIDEAEANIQEAKKVGVKGAELNQIEIRLNARLGTQKKAFQSEEFLKQELDNLIKLYNQNRFQQVLNKAKKLTEIYPKNLVLLNLMGACAGKLGQLDEAAYVLNKAIIIDPDIAEAHNNIGNIFRDQGKLEKAIDAYKEALTIKPNYADAYYNLGNIFQEKGKLDEAIEVYTKALSINPGFAEAHNNIGNTFKNQGKIDEAIEAYKKALTIKPDYADVFNNLGNVFKDQGKLEESIKAYNEALSIKPNYAEAYNNLGSALKKCDKLDEAIKAYKEALNIKPDYADVFNNLGNVFKDQGRLEESIKAYNKVMYLEPNNADAHYNKGNVLKKQGKLKKAIEIYKRALAIKPDYAEAYNNLGLSLQDQGKLKEAIKIYKRALAIKPDYAEAYNNFGLALQDQGKLKEAINAFGKALAIKPDYSDCYWNRSGIAENITEAKNWLYKCLETNPDHLKAQLTLSALQFYCGDKDTFNVLKKSSLKNHAYMRSFNWVFNLPTLPILHFHRWAFFDHMIALSKKDRPFYEFGVWRGEAFKYLIKTFKKGYGFDTFEGLPEDWHNEKAGTYSSEGSVPKIKGGKFIVGKFEDTLPGFFAEPRPMASIINFDADLYSSTICALNFSKPIIDQHTILIFDELIINKNWEQDEYKALEEFCSNNQFNYEVVAVSFFTKQVAVRIIFI